MSEYAVFAPNKKSVSIKGKKGIRSFNHCDIIEADDTILEFARLFPRIFVEQVSGEASDAFDAALNDAPIIVIEGENPTLPRNIPREEPITAMKKERRKKKK